MSEFKVNKIIAQFNGESATSEIKYTESWDKLIPTYQKLVLYISELSDENWMYLTDELNNKIGINNQTPLEFAQGLAEVIEQYNAETILK